MVVNKESPVAIFRPLSPFYISIEHKTSISNNTHSKDIAKHRQTYTFHFLLDLPCCPPLVQIMSHPLKVIPHEDRDDDRHDREGDDPESDTEY